jgi:hypothetical protein
MIKQQNLEKCALAQKMNSEFDEMNKIKQLELEKIVIKYRNKKFELETKQGKEKNIHDNENMLKATIFNHNLTNFSNNDGLMTINKTLNKSSIRMNNNYNINPFSERSSLNTLNLKEYSSFGKRPETAKTKSKNINLNLNPNTNTNTNMNKNNNKNLNVGLAPRKKSAAKNNLGLSYNNNNNVNINKSLKLLNLSSNGAKNLQYNTNLN